MFQWSNGGFVNGRKLDELESEGRRPEAEGKVRRNFFSYFQKNKDRIPFGEKAEALYTWLTEGKLSTRDKAIVIGTLLYFINPLDLVPDLTPFLGFTDDLGIVYFVYNYLQNRALEEVPGPKDD